MNKQIRYENLIDDPDGMRYILLERYAYKSNLFNRTITIPKGRKSDGATGVRDLGAKEKGWRRIWSWVAGHYLKTRSNKRTAAWFVHDELCLSGCWDDGTKITNFTCSTVLAIILHKDGYWLEAYTWWLGTFLGGGGEARKNGMLWLT